MAGLYPFEFSGRTSSFHRVFPWGFLKAILIPIKDVGLSDFLQNIVYFVPWGAIYYIFTASPNRRPRTLIISAALVGAIVSIAIEICQIFFSRDASAFDVLANTLGAGMGALLCALSPIDVRRRVARSLARAKRSQLLLPAALLLGIVPLLISVSKFPWTDFRNWDRGFTLQIANEASLDRPWLGRIYLVAIYDRALAPEEIARHYQLGASNEALGRRINRGLIALYTFSEDRGGQVSDVSGYGRPLNLTLSPVSHFRWLGQISGIEVIKPAILKTDGPAEKLYDALRASNELSVEVWMTPSNIVQHGPARIVSFSRDTLARNFTLGQNGADIDFRLRTPVSGTNGTAVNLRTRNGSLALRRTHVVVTYKEGIESLYVDGHARPDNRDLKKADIIVAFGTKKNPVAQMAYTFVYVFPVSCFLSLVFSQQFKGFIATLLTPVTIAVGLLSIAEVFQAHVFSRAIDLSLLGYGIIIAIAGAFTGTILATGTAALRGKFLFLRKS
jgi:VanZ like family/Concanavalin A-like lectin/glucanases superfamily